MQEFHTWLLSACTAGLEQRRQLLFQWTKAPGARDSHPREEHLIPLMVVAGAAHGDTCNSSSGRTADSGAAAEDSKGHVLWDGECMGAAVAGIGFGQFV